MVIILKFPHMKNLALVVCGLFLLGVTLELQDGQRIRGDLLFMKGGIIYIDTLVISKGEAKQVLIKDKEENFQLSDSIRKMALPDTMLFRLAKDGEKKYPDAPGIILVDWGQNILDNTGKQIYRYHFAAKILTEKRLSWASQNLYFEEGRNKITVLFARTISEEGESFWLNPNDIKVFAPSLGSEFFDVGKYVSFNFPGAKPGAIIEFEYIDSLYNPEIPEFFFVSYYFQDYEPVMWSRFQVDIPDSLNLNYRVYNAPQGKLEPEISIKEGVKSYVWELRDVPPIIEEPQMPAYGEVVPKVKGTTIANWEIVFDKLGEYQKRRMEIDEEAERLAKSIIGDAKTDSERIDRIYRFVQREIKYVSIKSSFASGETGHHWRWTLEHQLGDCTDKSILFSTLLRAIGIESAPIIIMTNDRETVDRTIPDTDGNHAIVLVKLNGKKYFLDPTSTTHIFPFYRSDDYGVSYFSSVFREIGTTTIPPAQWNAQTENLWGELDNKGKIHFFYKSEPYGNMDAEIRFWWETSDPKDYRRIFEQWCAELIPNAQLLKFSLSSPSDFSTPCIEYFEGKANDFVIFADGVAIIHFPHLVRTYDFPEIATEKRNYPIKYGYPILTRHKINIKLPKGWEAIDVPQPVAFSTRWANYTGRFSVSGGVLSFEDTFQRDSLFVRSEDYTEFRQFLKGIKEFVRKGVFLKVAPK